MIIMPQKYAILFIFLSFSALFYHSLFDIGWVSIAGAIIKSIISSLTFTLIITSIKSKTWRSLIITLLGLNFAALYFLALYYGRFTAGMLASIAESNSQEAIEYLSHLSFTAVAETCLITALLIFSSQNLKPFYNKLQLITLAASLLFVALTHLVTKGLNGTQITERDFRFTGEELVIKILAANANTLILAASYEYRTLKAIENKHTPSLWENVSKTQPSKDIYIVVIGESAIKKKLTLYGYSRATTDTLAATKNITIVSDAIAPSVITRISIPRLFNLSQENQINPGLNIIELANSAGFNTHWISNQGVMSNHDTPVFAIAKKAHHKVFLNSDYELAKNDRLLNTELQKIAQQQTTQANLIFLHTIGSHQDFCQRLDQDSQYLAVTRAITQTTDQECYDNSILNTYQLLKTFEATLIDAKLSYRMIYVADHALVNATKAPYYLHGTGNKIAKAALDVPMIFFEDTEVNSKLIKQRYFLSDFPHTLADWLGISATQINPQRSILNPAFDPRLQNGNIIDDKFNIRKYSQLN